LRALVRMMEKLRSGLGEAIEDRPIKLRNWWGAGAIAQALLSDYLGTGDDEDGEGGNEDYSPPTKTKRAAALGVINQECEPFKWSLHAYFGARIELLKQGVCNTCVNEIDVASAYPATTKELPSMKNGRWEHKTNLTREDVESANILSMFHVRTHGFTWYLPFYPLPFRTDKGGIIFPPSVEGYYMRDDVIGAFKWFDKFEQQRHNAEIELVSGWIFYPASDEKIFAWVQDLFDYRAGLVKRDKKDIRGYVIKLGLNSLYGKFAQHVGERGNPPKFALPVFAGAITAGTRRKLIEAALTRPNDVIAFATDGVYSTKALDVFVPETKQLGHWERKELKDGVFIQSGVNTMTDGDKRKSKTRGFTPNNLDKSADAIMREDIPQLWGEGKSTYEYPYTNYMTLGACVVTRKRWKLVGCWKIGKRTLEFVKSTNKRAVPTDLKWRQSRVKKLMDLPRQLFF
jgi:hypothetical protein